MNHLDKLPPVMWLVLLNSCLYESIESLIEELPFQASNKDKLMQELLTLIGQIVASLDGIWFLIKTTKRFILDIFLKNGKRVSFKVEDEETQQ